MQPDWVGDVRYHLSEETVTQALSDLAVWTTHTHKIENDHLFSGLA